MPFRLYKICLAVSLVVNVFFILAIWSYIHFAGTLEIVEEAVGFFN